jgi:hypothetical protein
MVSLVQREENTMSNAAICIRWGAPFVGRETKSLEVFMHAQEYWATLQKQGKIAAHRTYLASNGNMFAAGGFAMLEGEVQQLRAVVDSNEFRTLLLKAMHLVSNVEVTHMDAGDTIPKRIEEIVSVRKQLGII